MGQSYNTVVALSKKHNWPFIITQDENEKVQVQVRKHLFIIIGTHCNHTNLMAWAFRPVAPARKRKTGSNHIVFLIGCSFIDMHYTNCLLDYFSKNEIF